MTEYYVCYYNDQNGGSREVAIYKCNSAEEAEDLWVKNCNPYCYKIRLAFVTKDRARMQNFRFGR